jgi:hypothetical protein
MNLKLPKAPPLGLSMLKNIKLTDGRLLLACLSMGFFVRLVPELLAFPSPIGFDTIYYAYVMKSGVVWAHWSAFFSSTWLLNAFIIPLYNLTQVDPFLLLKVLAPFLFGLNVAGIYWFARKSLGWSAGMSVLASVFFSLQLASLRISWDLLRNTLGLGILLFAMSYVKDVKSNRGFALFTTLSLLSVFAHEYAAVLLFVAVFGLLVWGTVRKQVDLARVRVFLGVLPAFAVFMVGFGLRLSPVYSATSNVMVACDTVSGKASGLFFLVNYLTVQNSVDSYATYWNLAFSVVVLFAALFLPYLLLVVKGFFKNNVLTLWTGFLLIGAFGCLVIPFSALQYWYRWMFMLVYPFTFYAVSGLSWVWKKLPRGQQYLSQMWPFDWKASAMVCFTFYLGIAYLATPLIMPLTGMSVASVSQNYLYFSDSPTVPYKDADSVVQAMKWLDSNSGSGSCVILQHALLCWGEIYLDKNQGIVTFNSNLNLAVTTAQTHGYSMVYFVWWNTPVGWYSVIVPPNLVGVQDFGRISVYRCGDL